MMDSGLEVIDACCFDAALDSIVCMAAQHAVRCFICLGQVTAC